MFLCYIDPGTGSMLFAVLVGVIGTIQYLFRSWGVRLKFFFGGGKTTVDDNKKTDIVIFSDDKRYWRIFKSICIELDNRGIETRYYTASEDDPALTCNLKNVQVKFIGKGNKAFAQMNFIKATIVLSTTPGLDVYQWKRSKDVDCYIHILHAPNEIAGYRMFGTDYYDVLLLSGHYQEEDTRELEKTRNLRAKEIYYIGIPYLDDMVTRLKECTKAKGTERTVLLAPSWGPSSILNKYDSEIIDILLDTEYNIIIRPHPQSFISEKELVGNLMERYPESDQLEWNSDEDNFDVLARADIIISDFSGVIFDFALVFDKPVIYADTKYESDPYDAWWLSHEIWTFKILPNLGEQLTRENMPHLKSIIDNCLTNEKYSKGRIQAREETWMYRGEGTVRAADYLETKLADLKTGR